MTCESEQTGAVVQTVLKNEETEKVKEKIEEMIERGRKGSKGDGGRRRRGKQDG